MQHYCEAYWITWELHRSININNMGLNLDRACDSNKRICSFDLQMCLFTWSEEHLVTYVKMGKK